MIVRARPKPAVAKKLPTLVQTSVTGTEVRSLRERLGLSLRKFGRLLGMSGNSVSSWEHKEDEPPRMHQASWEALERALHMTPEEVRELVGTWVPKLKGPTGAEIKALRQSVGLSQIGFGKMLGVRHETIGLWEGKGNAVIRMIPTSREAFERVQQMSLSKARKLAKPYKRPRKGRPHPLTGAAVKHMREEMKLTRADLAWLLGVAWKSVERWECRDDEVLHLRPRARAAINRLRRRFRLDPSKVAEALAAKRRRAIEKAHPLKRVMGPQYTGRSIASLRAHLGLSQRDLAMLVGVTFSTVNDWEHRGDNILFFADPATLSALRMLRRMGNRQIRRRLAQITGTQPQSSITGDKVKKMRLRLGLLQTEFGKLIGVPKSTIGRWELQGGRSMLVASATVSAIFAIGKIGKREARERLEQMTRPQTV